MDRSGVARPVDSPGPDGPDGAGSDPARLLEALRAWASAFSEFGRHFGADAGLHVTDSDALIHIIGAEDRGAPLTQSELSRRIGISPGATSSLLNRLEDAGHIDRRRESADRRVVTVWSTPAVHERVGQYFAEVSEELDTVITACSPEITASLDHLLRDMTAVLDRHLMRRRT